MTRLNPSEYPHRRLNPLTGEWVLVSPHRVKRPWKGQVEKPSPEDLPVYDPVCYLCPGNMRASGEKNPHYQSTFVFTNDFSALLPEIPAKMVQDDPLFNAKSVSGTCRVLCFSPRHDLTLPEMDLTTIHQVVNTWAAQVAELGSDYQWVQVFENKGEVMGCSNPHPHGQIWAGDFLPNEPFKEDTHQLAYFQKNRTPLLLDYAEKESAAGARIIVENQDWFAVIPYWAIWPFETLLIPRLHRRHLPELSQPERASLAEILQALLIRYDNLFQISFPYSMGWHGQPFGGEGDHWQLHAHFYPPLLRSAWVKKFMVGYEMLAEAQRDLTAEQAAEQLRSQPVTHYRKN